MELQFIYFKDFMNLNRNRSFTVEHEEERLSGSLVNDLLAYYLSSDIDDIPELSTEQEAHIAKLIERESNIYQFYFKGLINEINYNLAIIATDGQVSRYLNYIGTEFKDRYLLLSKGHGYDVLLKNIKIFKYNEPISDYFKYFIWNMRKIEMAIEYVSYLQQNGGKQKLRKTLISDVEIDHQDPFTSLFKSDYIPYIQNFVDILSQVTPPLITINSEWIKPLNAAQVFVEILKEKGVINPKSTIEAIYNGFDFKFNTGRTFMKSSKMVKANDYRKDLSDRVDSLLKNLSP